MSCQVALRNGWTLPSERLERGQTLRFCDQYINLKQPSGAPKANAHCSKPHQSTKHGLALPTHLQVSKQEDRDGCKQKVRECRDRYLLSASANLSARYNNSGRRSPLTPLHYRQVHRDRKRPAAPRQRGVPRLGRGAALREQRHDDRRVDREHDGHGPAYHPPQPALASALRAAHDAQVRDADGQLAEGQAVDAEDLADHVPELLRRALLRREEEQVPAEAVGRGDEVEGRGHERLHLGRGREPWYGQAEASRRCVRTSAQRASEEGGGGLSHQREEHQPVVPAQARVLGARPRPQRDGRGRGDEGDQRADFELVGDADIALGRTAWGRSTHDVPALHTRGRATIIDQYSEARGWK